MRASSYAAHVAWDVFFSATKTPAVSAFNLLTQLNRKIFGFAKYLP